MKCLHAALDGRFDEGAGVRRVVEVVAERIGDRFRHHDLGREMGDRVDPVLLDQPGDEIGVAGVADDEPRGVGHRPVEAGRQIVEHDDALARVQEAQRHMAADIAGPAGHQNTHVCPFPFPSALLRPKAPRIAAAGTVKQQQYLTAPGPLCSSMANRYCEGRQ